MDSGDIDIAVAMVRDILAERIARAKITCADVESDASAIYGIARLLTRLAGRDPRIVALRQLQSRLAATAIDLHAPDTSASLRELHRVETEAFK